MSLLRKAALAGAASALALAASAVPAVAQPAQPPAGGDWVLVASSGDFTAMGSWNKSTSYGKTAGTISMTKADGWVEDTAADSYCAQVVIEWFGTNGKYDADYSPQACPKGNRDTFAKAAGDSTHWTATGYAVWMQKV
ncbi:hypothetical protein ACFQ7W_03185 [Streptomyces niveus]|uniref:hypothetical protein n=1 Tax=Streptomyces niveus TaxID=193462 RepID=UPI0036C560AF